MAMPWYEPEDFAQLWALAQDRDLMPSDYEVWLERALLVMSELLALGRAVEIVTIRPAEFLVWLAETGLPNTASTRLRYVELRAMEDGVSLENSKCLPGPKV